MAKLNLPWEWKCPSCHLHLRYSTQLRMEQGMGRHVCAVAGNSPPAPEPPEEAPMAENPPTPEESLFPPPEPSAPGPATSPDKKRAIEPPPPQEDSDLARAILMLAEGQKRLSENQAALSQMMAQQHEMLAQSARNSQWLKERVETYAQPAPLDGAVSPGGGGIWGGGVNISQITNLLSLLKGPQASNPLEQLTALGNTLNQIRVLTAPFQEEYSRGARDTADAILKASRVGVEPAAMAESIIGTHEAAAARVRAAPQNEPPKT